MTGASSNTAAGTWSRFNLLVMQVRVLLREAAQLSDKDLDSIAKGLKDPHYIGDIVVTGLFKDDTMGARLTLRIDWREHALRVKADGPQVRVPTFWTDGVSPAVKEAVRTFQAAVEVGGLRCDWGVHYQPHFPPDQARKALGFSPGPTRKWARDPDRVHLTLDPLGEVGLEIEIAVG